MTRSSNACCRVTSLTRDTSGETLVEVLAAVLVSTLALVMLATAVRAASGIVIRNSNTMEQYFEATNELTKEGSSDDSVTITASSQLGAPTTGGDPKIKWKKQELYGGNVAVTYAPSN